MEKYLAVLQSELLQTNGAVQKAFQYQVITRITSVQHQGSEFRECRNGIQSLMKIPLKKNEYIASETGLGFGYSAFSKDEKNCGRRCAQRSSHGRRPLASRRRQSSPVVPLEFAAAS